MLPSLEEHNPNADHCAHGVLCIGRYSSPWVHAKDPRIRSYGLDAFSDRRMQEVAGGVEVQVHRYLKPEDWATARRARCAAQHPRRHLRRDCPSAD